MAQQRAAEQGVGVRFAFARVPADLLSFVTEYAARERLKAAVEGFVPEQVVQSAKVGGQVGADDVPCYVVVEVSYTANGRDTTRAVRSAGLLSRFSGKSAYPVIAGVRVDNETREAIDAGEIQYYELEANR